MSGHLGSGNNANSPFSISGSGSLTGGISGHLGSGNNANSPFSSSGSGSLYGVMNGQPGSENAANSPFSISGSGSLTGSISVKPGSGNEANSPFTIAGSGSLGGGFYGLDTGGNSMGTAGSGVGMASPFSTGNKGGTGNGQGPFSMSSSGDSGGKGGSGKGMPSPFSTSDAAGGGPGSFVGGSFAMDMMDSAGPGGLTGGSFDIGTGSYGPGGLAGGAFDLGGSSGFNGDGDKSLYDTDQYQAMLKDQFKSDLYEPGLTGISYSGGLTANSALAGNSNSGSTSAEQDSLMDYNKNPYYSLGSYSVSSGSGWDSSTSQAAKSDEQNFGNPFDLPYDELLSNPLSSHSNTGKDVSTFGGFTAGSANLVDSSMDSVKSLFNIDKGYSSPIGSTGIGGFNNPGGNPANQKGSMATSFQDPSRQGSPFKTFNQVQRRRLLHKELLKGNRPISLLHPNSTFMFIQGEDGSYTH
ncbi:WAG22 antigen-like [Ylistrum balloti]|uniref:WAG22 antigen-like n=1 Tax=Ylistrum balloti TaxID=509963 RepID=UPI002905A6D6|nr:WAG22 antigen-like [Ylistrum balloti]